MQVEVRHRDVSAAQREEDHPERRRIVAGDVRFQENEVVEEGLQGFCTLTAISTTSFNDSGIGYPGICLSEPAAGQQ